jgi:RNA polymerase sigma-70 factor, ECF subfamily
MAEGEVVRLPLAREAPRDFRTFFEDEHRRLFKTLYFVTGDRSEAADLMQDAFLRLWERWDRIETIDDPRAYLFRVAVNGWRMRARAARTPARDRRWSLRLAGGLPRRHEGRVRDRRDHA